MECLLYLSLEICTSYFLFTKKILVPVLLPPANTKNTNIGTTQGDMRARQVS